jgi:hypothetical protein
MKNVCLEHLIEHGDRLLNDFTDLLNHLEKSTDVLMKEVNNAATQVSHVFSKKVYSGTSLDLSHSFFTGDWRPSVPREIVCPFFLSRNEIE